MRLLILLIPLLLAGLAGFVLAQQGKRRALAREYALHQTVVVEARRLIAADPIGQPQVYLAQRALTQAAIDDYENQVREL